MIDEKGAWFILKKVLQMKQNDIRTLEELNCADKVTVLDKWTVQALKIAIDKLDPHFDKPDLRICAETLPTYALDSWRCTERMRKGLPFDPADDGPEIEIIKMMKFGERYGAGPNTVRRFISKLEAEQE